MLPAKIVELIKKRGHLRNLEVKMAKEYPKVLNRLQKYPSFAEGIYVEMYGRGDGCKVCGAPTTFVNFVRGYLPSCCLEHGQQLASPKRQQTMQRRHGVSYPMQNPQVKAKFTRTMQHRYGVLWAMQSTTLRQKALETNYSRYGAPTFVSSDTGRKFLASVASETQAKREETFLRHYGVRSPLQCHGIREKQQRTARLLKEVVIEGKKFMVRGYEDKALRWLVDKGINPNRITIRAKDGLPSIKWKDKKGQEHFYFPDMLIGQYVVEVKSTYTLGLRHPAEFQRVRRKFLAAQEAGYKTVLLLASRNNRVVMVKSPHKFNRSYFVDLAAKAGIT